MTTPKKTITKLSTGIYRDEYSIRAIVNIAAGRKEKRFDFDTPLQEIKRWRNATKAKLELLYPQKRAGAQRGTFNAAVARYLKGLAIASWKSRRSELRAWQTRFGNKKRARITEDDIRLAVKAWSDDGTPPKTILNRVRAFTAMAHTLDGPDSWTPADNVALPKVRKKIPDYVPPSTIMAVEKRLREMELAGALPDAKWRARFMVINACGARPTHLKRAQPQHVDLDRRVWNVVAAKDGNPVELYLNDDMLAAWENFIAAGAWGAFDDTEYARIVRAAGWPAGVRPYNAKHSFGKDLGEAGVDMQTIADWYGHTDVKTTRIYVPVLNSKIRQASELMNGRLGWAPPSGRILDAAPAPSDEDRQEQILALLSEISAGLKSRQATDQ